MTNWRPDFNPDSLYFVTTKAVRYAHLFRRDVTRRLLVDTFDCLRLRGRFQLYTFVVMPNHVHLILQCHPGDPLQDVLRDLKKHIADRVIRHYRIEGNERALAFLAAQVTRPKKQRRKVWEDGYNAKEIFAPNFLRQKMTYCHGNPCQPHWNLAASPEAYPWSSARYYLLGEPPIIPVDDARVLLA